MSIIYLQKLVILYPIFSQTSIVALSEYFKRIFDNSCFTPIEEWEFHDQNQTALQNGYAMFSPDGGWMELNDSWYLNRTELPTKYFKTYNDFMDFCFKNPIHPKYRSPEQSPVFLGEHDG